MQQKSNSVFEAKENLNSCEPQIMEHLIKIGLGFSRTCNISEFCFIFRCAECTDIIHNCHDIVTDGVFTININ